MTTFNRELIAHCTALLTVLEAAGVPAVAFPDHPTAPDTWVALRPALRVLRVPHDAQRWIEQRIREEPEHYQPVLVPDPATSWRILVMRLHPFTQFLVHGRHPACTTYCRWQNEVHMAFL